MTDVTSPTSPTEPQYHRQYGPRTSATEVVKDLDLTGKTIAITGTTNGIGIETARSLALKGAHLVLFNRSILQAEQIRDKIYAETEYRKIDLIHMDLSSLQSVEHAAKEFLSKGWSLHVLILNAGVFAPEPKYTIDGYNSTFAINHLGHFYLTYLLKEKLVENAPSRVVVVSSESHRHTLIKPAQTIEAKMELLFPPAETSTVAYLLYARSKLANVLFSKKLHRELFDKGVHIYVLHPGSMIGTSIGRSYGAPGRLLNYLVKPFTKTLDQGAATSVYCAVHPGTEKDSGRYYESCWDEEKNLAKPLADDEQLQDALWDKSLELIQKYESQRAK